MKATSTIRSSAPTFTRTIGLLVVPLIVSRIVRFEKKSLTSRMSVSGTGPTAGSRSPKSRIARDSGPIVPVLNCPESCVAVCAVESPLCHATVWPAVIVAEGGEYD